MKPQPSILLTSLAGDALAFGPHWIYDQRVIADKLGPITGYADPMSSYHPGKQAGDFTHYGDQTMILLRSVARHGRFDLTAFAAEWRAFWESPETVSYRDGASRGTLENLGKGLPPEQAASSSHDMAGAARIAPLFLLKWESTHDLLAAARAQTAFTHGDPQVIECAEFFARVTLAVQAGAAVPEALRATAALPHWQAIPGAWFHAAESSATAGLDDSAAAVAHGLSCNVADAFPLICHFLLRHPADAAKALAANARAGGDSAARGLLLGMIYGAAADASGALPADWISGLRNHSEIQQAIQELSV